MLRACSLIAESMACACVRFSGSFQRTSIFSMAGVIVTFSSSRANRMASSHVLPKLTMARRTWLTREASLARMDSAEARDPLAASK